MVSVAVKAGKVEVPVTPDTTRFRPELRKSVIPAATAVAEQAGKIMGSVIARQISDGVRDGLDNTRASSTGVKSGREFGKAFARTANAEIRNMLKDQRVKAIVNVDTKGIAQLRAQLKTIRDKDVRVGVNVTGALANLERLRVKLAEIGALKPNVKVDVDSAKAKTELTSVAAMVRRLNGRDANIRINTNNVGRAQAAVRGLLALAISLGPALIPVAGAVAAAFAGIGTAALGAGAGIGVLALAIVPVVSAVQALSQQQTRAATTAGQLARSQIQQANAADQVRDAEQAVARAVEDARLQQIESARRVADARRAVADATRDAARDEADAIRDVEDAERRLSDAQRDALDAQEAVNEARKEAARDLEDLQSRLAGAVLDERDANLRLAEARQRAAEVNADPKATELERQRAALAVEEAVQRLQDQQRELARLREDQKAAADAGVDGSERVKNAEERLRDAQRQVSDAQQGIADAVERANQRREDSARRVADAEEDLARVVADAAVAQRRAAEDVAKAQQGVIRAQRAVESAAISAGTVGGATLAGLEEKLARLSPEGRRFADFILKELQPALVTLSKSAQTGLLPGLQAGLEALLPAIPPLSRFVGELARVMGDLAVEASEALQGPWWRQFFAFIGETAAPALEMFLRTLGNLVTGFAGLFQAFAPVGMSFGETMLVLSERFADFGKNAKNSKGFQDFLAYLQKVGPKVGKFIVSFARAFGNLVKSLTPVGEVILSALTGVLNFIAGLDPAVIKAIAVGFIAIAAAVTVVNLALAAMSANPIVLVVAALAAIYGAMYVLYKRNKTFREFWDASWERAKKVLSVAWNDVIKPVFNAISSFIKDDLGPAMERLWKEIIVPAWDGISKAIGHAWEKFIKPALKEVKAWIDEIIGPVFRWLWKNIIEPAWQGIRSAIGKAWDFIKPIFRAVVRYINDVLIPAFKKYLLPAVRLAWQLIDRAIQIAWGLIRIAFAAMRKYIRDVLGPVFSWLYNRIVKPVWGKISDAIEWAWKNVIKPVFSALGNFLKDKVVPAFKAGVDAIGKAWAKVADVAKKPIKFIINTVINKGIIDTYKRVAGWFGVDTGDIQHIELPKGFATGGRITGPGTGTSDSILAAVSNGEYVIRAAAVKALGVDFLDLLNQADRKDLAGDIANATPRKYATGGLVDRVRDWLPSVDPLPYVWGAVGPSAYDCSGLTGEAYNRLTGRPSFNRVFTTASDFRAMGFERGIGTFTLGLDPNKHVVGNLGGLPFEARSTQTGIFVGPQATSVLRMPQQWYLPSFGGSKSGDSGGIDILNPIASVKALFGKALAPLRRITDTRFGHLVAEAPRALVDGAVESLSAALPGFAGGGLVKYDRGGYLPPGVTTVLNATGKPEPVMTPAQWDAMNSLGAGRSITINQYQVGDMAPQRMIAAQRQVDALSSPMGV